MNKKIIILILILLCANILFAINIYNPKSLALGDAFLTRSSGFQSLEWNPANLGLKTDNVTLNLFHLDMRLKNNSISLGTYNKTTGDSLDENEKQKLLDNIPDSGMNLFTATHLNLPFASFSVWKIGFSISEQTYADITLPKDMFDLLLFGNTVNEEFDFSDADVKVVSFLETKFGYGQQIYPQKIFPKLDSLPPIYAGISMGIISGLGYAEMEKLTSTFKVQNNGYSIIENDMKVKTAGVNTTDSTVSFADNKPAGIGFRSNIGFYSPINEKWTVGLAINNIFGFINWQNDCEEVCLTIISDTLNILNFEDSLVVDTTYAVGSFTQSLPVELHLGAEYNYSDFYVDILFFMNYVQGFKNSVITSTTPKVSFGAEYAPLKWLPIRTGIGFGGKEGIHFSFGTGLCFNHFEFNWGIRNYGALFYGAKGLGFSTSMQLKF
ncbi:MAG: DUF5723 family protein [Candidatus Cloacimonadota bacterium]|nr:DUF5723 family protein [Candidatus Cloacimonadota bacterium]